MNIQKLSALLFLVCSYNPVISMEIIPYKKSHKSCFYSQDIQFPQEIHQEIGKHVFPFQWWYLQQFYEHNRGVNSVCFNNTGTLLVTASNDKTARMFDVQEKKEVASFSHNDWVKSVCFNNTGALLATASDDKKVRMFDVQEKKEVDSFSYHDYLRSACFNNTGALLATASHDKTARMFDVQEKKEIASFPHDGCVNSACFNNTGTLLVTASNDKTARMFDVQEKKEVAFFEHDGSVNSVCFNNTGTLFATASSDGKARIFARYDIYTLDQLILKKAFNSWLLVEKPDKRLDNLEKLLADVACKHECSYDALFAAWKTFPEYMQAALRRTMQHRIQTHGK
jgi:WD40 repeat protein